MDDAISRQAVLKLLSAMPPEEAITKAMLIQSVKQIDAAQPKTADCIYCHEDSDGYVKPIEKNCHAFIRFGMNGWEISLSAKGWNGSAKIMYCPMCGRRLSE